MDDDLVVSNEAFLRDLVEYSRQIELKLAEFRSRLKSTVDSVSKVEHSRESSKSEVTKQFDNLEQSLMECIQQRRKTVLDEIDKQCDSCIKSLLRRAHGYQTGIGEAANLQTAILALQKREALSNPHLQTGHPSILPSPAKPPSSATSSSWTSMFGISGSTHTPLPPPVPPPPRPPPPALPSSSSSSAGSDTSDAVPKGHISKPMKKPSQVSVVTVPRKKSRTSSISGKSKSMKKSPSPMLDHHPKKPVFDFHDEDCDIPATKFRKQKLISEIRGFLLEQIPLKLSPSVHVFLDSESVLNEISSILTRYGIVTSNKGEGGYSKELLKGVSAISSALSWSSSVMSDMILGRKELEEELEEIPPPLLVVYDELTKSVAEDFVELLTIYGSVPSGCVIPIVSAGSDPRSISDWLGSESDEQRKRRQRAVHSGSKSVEPALMGSYFGHELAVDSDEKSAPVLRSCVLVYNASKVSTESVNQRCDEWLNDYDLKSMVSVELRSMSSESVPSDCPRSFVGSVIFHETDGILDGQTVAFQAISKAIFHHP